MQVHQIPIFKDWVPEWLARTVIFAVLLNSILGFALYYNNPESTVGYYGIEPSDVQYSVVVMYASVVSFLALDFRIIKYFTTRKYLLIGLALNAVTYVICFYTKNWILFLICRFVQGAVCALFCNIVLNLIFPRLHSGRSRVIGYTIFYGSLQVSIPVCGIYCSYVLYYFNFNWLFYGLVILSLPVLFAVLLTMNSKSRIHKKIPLYYLDLTGYFFYTVFCLLAGYILVYGQQLNWFENQLIWLLTAAGIILLVLFAVRENRLKRPLINLEILKAKNFVTGLFLLFAFYIFKGTSGFTYGYIESILGVDPLNIIPIWVFTIVVTIISMFITARFILTGTPLIRIVTVGFFILALFYIYMLCFVSNTGETNDFIIPTCLFAIASGVVFVPAVAFTVSSAPPKIAFNASFIGIFARFLGFCTSIAINNYVQLYTKAAVYEKVRESMNELNPQLDLTLQNIQNAYINQGSDFIAGKNASGMYLKTLIREQILARSIRDYYEIMLVSVIVVIILLILTPGLNKVIIRLRKGSLPY